MGHSAPQVFSGISPEQFAKLTVKAQAAGIDLGGNSGTASKFGVEVSWNYSPESQQLTLQCLSTPFFVKPEEVNAKIQALVKESLG
jgi:hypothetical protein